MSVSLQFVTSDDPISKRIQWADFGFWPSHVDIVLPDKTLLGARFDGGVQIRQPGYEKFSKSQVLTLQTTWDQETSFYLFAKAQIGKEYDLVDLLANFDFERDWRNGNKWWCSELGAAALEVGGIMPKVPNGVNHVSPGALYCYMVMLGAK